MVIGRVGLVYRYCSLPGSQSSHNGIGFGSGDLESSVMFRD